MQILAGSRQMQPDKMRPADCSLFRNANYVLTRDGLSVARLVSGIPPFHFRQPCDIKVAGWLIAYGADQTVSEKYALRFRQSERIIHDSRKNCRHLSPCVSCHLFMNVPSFPPCPFHPCSHNESCLGVRSWSVKARRRRFSRTSKSLAAGSTALAGSNPVKIGNGAGSRPRGFALPREAILLPQ